MDLFQISNNIKNTDNPTYISLGNDCTIAYHLQKLGLKTATFPFDWLETPNILLLVKLIHNDFNDLFNHFMLKGINYGPIIENNWNEQKLIMINIKNNKYDIIFKHDFASLLYPNRKLHSEIQKNYNNRIFEFNNVMQDKSKYKKIFRIGKSDEKNKINCVNDIFINKGYSNYTIFHVPDNIPISANVDTVPIIDISQVDTIDEKWKKNHYNWLYIFNAPLHNY